MRAIPYSPDLFEPFCADLFDRLHTSARSCRLDKTMMSIPDILTFFTKGWTRPGSRAGIFHTTLLKQ